MEIKGKRIRLRPARIEDRRKIFEWLTQSDVTPSMMGPPTYPDCPLTVWEEFKQDYTDLFFDDRCQSAAGKNYIILVGEDEVGTIGYDNLDAGTGSVDLDVWMRAERFCGHGYGTDAIDALVEHLHRTQSICKFSVDPSSRNTRAINAYRKCGFVSEELKDPSKRADYSDNNIMVKKIGTNP